ncbi:MAG: methylmalonyl Co-A mutase-associated GTPase MeaB [Dehalococcoidia bacterium]|nr:MAG: methylmalonyl Co-A mutase-associated GTPase MeaB [Dehalococcoidia bacterium]
MELAGKILKGNISAAARLIRGIEDELPDAVDELKSIYPHTGEAGIVGITGAPGVGKSTLVDSLVGVFRKRGMTVGVVAIDPTSPFSGGAILGDRIRMQQHNMDKGVFIRSLATRGWVGGLAKATMNTIHVMDAMGKDIILVETVGSGQAEIDIVRVADTAILALTPGMGDEIQMMKAGILEATDIFVINKADGEGTDNLKTGLEVMLGMKDYLPGEWQPSIILTEAISDRGTEELAEEILRHREFLVSSGELEKCRKERARLELMAAIEGSLKNYIYQRIGEDNYLEKLIDSLAQRKTNPHAAAQEIIARFSKQL